MITCETVLAQSNLIDSLLRVVARHSHDTTEIEVLDMLVNEFMRKDIDKAKGFIYQQIALSKTLGTELGLSGGYSGLVTIHRDMGRLDSAKYYLDKLEILSKKNPNDLKLASNYAGSAGLFYKNQGKYKEALPYLLDALHITELRGDQTATYAGQLLNIGNAYFNLANFKKATEYHLKSLTKFEALKNERGQSFCFQGLGNDFFRLNQFAKARDYFQRSFDLKGKLQDKRGMLTSLTALGDANKELGNYTVAENQYQKAKQEAIEMKLPGDELRALNQLGLLYKQLGETPKARENITAALKLARQSGDSTLSATIQGNLVEIYLKEEQEKSVEHVLITNLATIINSGDLQEESNGYSRLSEYYASKNQFDKAFDYLKKHEQLKDSVEGSAILLQMKQLEEQYKSEKKEKQIVLLKKDQELQTLALSRQRANLIIVALALISVVIISILLINRYRVIGRAKRLVEMERMRSSISRDLHDDIGSTLSSINIISKLAMNENNGNAHRHLQRIGEHSAKMMESMSDIVWSINPNNDSLEQVITKMKEFASEILDPMDVSYSFSGEENLLAISLDVFLRKNVFLIFKEVINNAAKYSGATTISINFGRKANTLQLSITDNGKGFNPMNGSSGNGLRNMKERARASNGILEINSSPNNGTAVILSIPLT